VQAAGEDGIGSAGGVGSPVLWLRAVAAASCARIPFAVMRESPVVTITGRVPGVTVGSADALARRLAAIPGAGVW